MNVPISLPEKEGNRDNEMKREKTQKTKKRETGKKTIRFFFPFVHIILY